VFDAPSSICIARASRAARCTILSLGICPRSQPVAQSGVVSIKVGSRHAIIELAEEPAIGEDLLSELTFSCASEMLQMSDDRSIRLQALAVVLV